MFALQHALNTATACVRSAFYVNLDALENENLVLRGDPTVSDDRWLDLSAADELLAKRLDGLVDQYRSMFGDRPLPRLAPASCSNCGAFRVGVDCYHICFNSHHYYSPEQERADDAFYGDDDHFERYAAERHDLERETFYADQLDAEQLDVENVQRGEPGMHAFPTVPPLGYVPHGPGVCSDLHCKTCDIPF